MAYEENEVYEESLFTKKTKKVVRACLEDLARCKVFSGLPCLDLGGLLGAAWDFLLVRRIEKIYAASCTKAETFQQS